MSKTILVKSRFFSKRNWISLFLGTALTVVLLSWALKDISLTAVWAALKSVRLEWLFLAWIAYVASYWVRAQRWGTLLAAHCQPGRFKIRLAATFIGFAANNVLPAQAGELIRPAVLYRLERVPFAATVGSVLVERLLDIGVVFLFLLIPLWMGALPKHSGLNLFLLGCLAAALVVIWLTCLIATCFAEPMARLIGMASQWIGLGRFQSRLESGVVKFLGGLSALRQPQRCLTALVESFWIWGLNAIAYWTALIAFNIATPGFLGALFTQSLTALAIALPSTPGYIGPFEAGIRFALNIYSVPADTIVAYAIALRCVMNISTVIIGFAIAARFGLSLSSLTAKANLKSDTSTEDFPST